MHQIKTERLGRQQLGLKGPRTLAGSNEARVEPAAVGLGNSGNPMIAKFAHISRVDKAGETAPRAWGGGWGAPDGVTMVL